MSDEYLHHIANNKPSEEVSHEEIAEQVKAYLAQGGTIEQVEPDATGRPGSGSSKGWSSFRLKGHTDRV